jgi:hypothetical protein
VLATRNGHYPRHLDDCGGKGAAANTVIHLSFVESRMGVGALLPAKSCNYLDSNSLVEEVKSVVIVCERNAVTHLRSGFSSSRSFAA